MKINQQIMSETPVKWGCIIVAGGTGSRFGGDIPKQFVHFLGKPILKWSVDTVLSIPDITELVIVLPESSPVFNFSPDKYAQIPVITVKGGEKRQDSVRNGMNALRTATRILIHDGARPFASRELFLKVIRENERTGNAVIPVIPVRDTIKEVREQTVLRTLDRNSILLSQTPQAFLLNQLRDAMKKYNETVTDESCFLEKCGIPVGIVDGEFENIKITRKKDLLFAETLFRQSEKRIGTGIDFHPFENGRPLILAGCRFESSRGLAGHSDGDVVLHAISDAILSASRLGDIGTLFPPDDEKWRNADSANLLREIISEVRGKGWFIDQVDVTVIGNHPLISPAREKLISSLASICSISPECVWIKGTTTNGLGFAGRDEGLAATALVQLSIHPHFSNCNGE